MRNVLLTVIAALQLATLGLVAYLHKGAESTSGIGAIEGRLDRLDAQLHLLVEVAVLVDELRLEIVERKDALVGDASVPAAAGTAPAAQIPQVAAVDEGVLFGATKQVLDELKITYLRLHEALEGDVTFVGPLKTRVDEKRGELLRSSTEALHWVAAEVTRQPYDEDREPEFIQYLLEEVVPALAAGDLTETFKLARQALVTKTNEPSVRQAAAHALRAIDPELWVREIIPVVVMGGGSGKIVALRCQLLQMFVRDPRPEIIEPCQQFIANPSYPISLRNAAVQVLAEQPADGVLATLRDVVLEEQTPELRHAALDGLYRRLGGQDQMRALLEKILDDRTGAFPLALREKAERMLGEIEGRTKSAPTEGADGA
jgi:hypothetical protein